MHTTRGKYIHRKVYKHTNLRIFKNLPPELLSNFVIPSIARDCLYVCKEWYSYAINNIFHDRRVIKPFKAPNNSTICGVRILPRIVNASRVDLLQGLITFVKNKYKLPILRTEFIDSVIPHVTVEMIELLVDNLTVNVDDIIVRSVKYNRHDILKSMMGRSKDPRVPLSECFRVHRIYGECLRVMIEYKENGYNIDLQHSMTIYLLCLNNMTDILEQILSEMKVESFHKAMTDLCLMNSPKCIDMLVKEFYVHRFINGGKERINLVPYIHKCIETGNCESLSVLLNHKRDFHITRKKVLELYRGNRQDEIFEILGKYDYRILRK